MRRVFAALLILLVAGASVPQAQGPLHVYVSPVDGDPTTELGYHSRCLGMAGSGNIDLRPDVDGFLCSSNELPDDLTGVEILGASLKGSLGAKKSELDAKFKKTLKANTVEELIVEIIEPKLITGKDGKKKIYLGPGSPIYQQTAWVPFRDNGLVADLTNFAADLAEPALAWAATISDNFTAADGNLDGCCTSVWTEFSGTPWTIVSNQAKAAATSTTGVARNTANDFATTDHTATITVVSVATGDAINGTNTTCALFIRKAADSTATFYRTTIQISDAGELNQTLLQKTLVGTTTTLGTDTSDWSANDTITISANGSTIEGQRSGGSLMSVTDTSITTGNNYGIRYFSDYTTGSPDCTLDTLTGSDISTTRSRGNVIWFN